MPDSEKSGNHPKLTDILLRPLGKVLHSLTAHMCRLFYQGKTTSPNLETIIARNIIPIRPDRHRERKLTAKAFHGFLYRVA